MILKYKAPHSSVERFRSWNYGMFVHFGLYSILGRGEWVMCKERIPAEEYRKLANQFNPDENCVENWVDAAKNSGMRYMCLTARHHDGFCLFDTATTDYTSLATSCGRDLLSEYVEACRSAGLGVGIYYSVGSWEDAGFVAGEKNKRQWDEYVARVHAQLKELMENYGRIDYLFYDGCPPPQSWDAAGINSVVRELQPEILISERCGTDEDVASSENHCGAHPGKLWESCYTLNDSWAYNKFDDNWKSPCDLVNMFAGIAHNGGNLLLNVGPTPDGLIQQDALNVIECFGDWIDANQKAFYGRAPYPFNYIDQELSTGDGDNNVYITLINDYGPERVIAGIGNRVNGINILSTGESIQFNQENDRIYLMGLDYPKKNELPRVLRLELDGPPKGVDNPRWSPEKFRIC